MQLDSLAKKIMPWTWLLAILGIWKIYEVKGISQLQTDLTSLTWTKVQERYMYAVYAGIAFVIGGYAAKSIKNPLIKLVVVALAWYYAGYELALFIDPPGTPTAGSTNNKMWSSANSAFQNRTQPAGTIKNVYGA